jgi:hypothetical protein
MEMMEKVKKIDHSNTAPSSKKFRDEAVISLFLNVSDGGVLQ